MEQKIFEMFERNGRARCPQRAAGMQRGLQVSRLRHRAAEPMHFEPFPVLSEEARFIIERRNVAH